ncbi:hypothetical protein QB910_000044 [Dabrowskivirus KKP3916]|uniref:Holin n=1 Tax=Alicyclobacillus phage KKP_3916 TaxID=3040651 RepID=A0AAT9V7I0_9CAUD|nr:hypothetical protein QB910_000044 [Alicyclobacillus phage KKP 3916]
MVMATALVSKIVLWLVGLAGTYLSVRLSNVPSKVVELLVHHVGIAKLKKIEALANAHKSVIEDAIKYVQERYATSKGAEKYKIVLEVVQKEFTRIGLPAIPLDQLEVIIHSVLKTVKGDFGSAWDDQVDSSMKNLAETTVQN